jgi:Domain of unknown function (DUF4062)
MARVYVSSTYQDLKECRADVRLALQRLHQEDVAMETYVAEPDRPANKCLKDVASCELYIGVFAWRYGYVPPVTRVTLPALLPTHEPVPQTTSALDPGHPTLASWVSCSGSVQTTKSHACWLPAEGARRPASTIWSRSSGAIARSP